MTPLHNIAVLISGNGSNLQAFIDAIAEGRLAAKITVVISNNPGAFGLERAHRAQIPTVVIDHHHYPRRVDFDQALLLTLQRFNAELIVLAGFMRILGETIIEHFPQRIINIHPSLLPKYPGLNTHQRALDAGDKNHGVTIHLVTSNLDAGPILAQQSFTIDAEDDANTLREKAHKIEHQLYPDVVAKITSGEIKNLPKSNDT
jgi:phosphoribosylglycinamide formyltransferase-1